MKIEDKDIDRFRKGIFGIIDNFRMQEFGNSRTFAFNGLKGTINMMIDSLVRGDIKRTVVFQNEVDGNGQGGLHELEKSKQ